MAYDLGFKPSDDPNYYYLICNTEDDTERVGEIAFQMSQSGIEICFDQANKYFKVWTSTIEEKILGCQAVILFFTKGILHEWSHLVEDEYKFARNLEKKIYVVLMDEIDDEDVPPAKIPMWFDIKNLQCIDVHAIADPHRVAEEIVSALNYAGFMYSGSSIELEPYSGENPYIFLSYSHKDAEVAMNIILHLQSNGFRVWYDEGITPGSEWDENIAYHIEKCRYFIALLSSGYLNSSNCKDELNYARDMERPRLLIYLEDIRLPGGMRMRLSRLQAIHKYKYNEQEVFFQKLYAAKGISVCRRFAKK